MGAVQVDWDAFSLTFIDIILSHPPLDWNFQVGDPQLLGSFGGAGAGALARVANGAWLRVGLFGGGFGVELDNRAEAGAYLATLQVSLFFAVLEFKLDMTYRVDIPAGVTKFVNTVLSKADLVLATVCARGSQRAICRMHEATSVTAPPRLAV